MKIKITIEAGDKKIEGENEIETEKQKDVQTHINKLYRKLKKELWLKKEE